MLEQRCLDLFRHLEGLQCLFEDLPTTRKMSAHNWMICVRFADRPASILNIGAQEPGRQLIFHLLDARAIGIAEKKPDHAIVEYSVDKCVDYRPQPTFATELLEQTVIHRQFNLYIMPSCRRAASDILLGSQGGSHTRSTLTSVTPDIALIFSSTSAGKACAAGQLGDVSVIWTVTVQSGSTLVP